jgi:hypothetical protein
MELGSITRIRLVKAEFVKARAVRVSIKFVAGCKVLLPDGDMAFGDWQPVRTQATDNNIVLNVGMIFSRLSPLAVRFNY